MYGAWEMGDAFAAPPAVYNLVLPKEGKLQRLAAQAERAVCRGKLWSRTIKLVRPLSDETGCASVTEMDDQDYTHVGRELEGYFAPRGLVVVNLALRHVRKVPHDMASYDVVEASFSVSRAAS